jgi:predicted HTH domain antitoxin
MLRFQFIQENEELTRYYIYLQQQSQVSTNSHYLVAARIAVVSLYETQSTIRKIF